MAAFALGPAALAANGAQPAGHEAQPAPVQEIQVQPPPNLDRSAPPQTRDSEFRGSPLGQPLTVSLIVLGFVLLVYVPWRARRALLARRAAT